MNFKEHPEGLIKQFFWNIPMTSTDKIQPVNEILTNEVLEYYTIKHRTYFQ